MEYLKRTKSRGLLADFIAGSGRGVLWLLHWARASIVGQEEKIRINTTKILDILDIASSTSYLHCIEFRSSSTLLLHHAADNRNSTLDCVASAKRSSVLVLGSVCPLSMRATAD